MANLWRGGTGLNSPVGTTNISDIDTVVFQQIVDPLDRTLSNYRRHCTVLYSSASALTVSVGEVACMSSGSVVRLRKNTSSTSVAWSDIDTGAEAASTYYYVYANADADATTFTVKISTSSSAPTGVTYYRKLGWFYNDSSSNILISNIGNIQDGSGVTNLVQAQGTSNITNAVSASWTDMTDMIIYYVSNGRPVKVTADVPLYNSGADYTEMRLDVDGTVEATVSHINGATARSSPCTLAYVENWSAGTHTIKLQWKPNGSTSKQDGATYARRLIVEEQ